MTWIGQAEDKRHKFGTVIQTHRAQCLSDKLVVLETVPFNLEASGFEILFSQYLPLFLAVLLWYI